MSDPAPVAAQPRPDASLVEVAAEIVAAYVAHNSVPAAELPGLIASVHGTFAGLGQAPAEVETPKPTPPVPVKKSITDDYLVSLEDGLRYKSLKRHLAKHGLTPEAYRAKWGLPKDYPMVAPAYARQRSEMAKGMGLGAQRRNR